MGQWPECPLAGLRTWTSMFLADGFRAGMAAAPALRDRGGSGSGPSSSYATVPWGCLNQPGF